jgi:hypothetical protein
MSINIITKSATDTQGGFVSGGAGTTEHGFGTFRYGSQVGDALSYRLYGNGFTRDETFSQVGDPHDGWQLGSGGVRMDWKPSVQSTLTVDGRYVHDAAGRRDERPQGDRAVFLPESGKRDHGCGPRPWPLDAATRRGQQLVGAGLWDRFSRFADSLSVRFDLTI